MADLDIPARLNFEAPLPLSGIIPIAAIIVHDTRNDEILLGKRMNVEEYGLYGMPGGKQHIRERIEDAARRELLEETGLKARVIRPLGYIDEFIHQHFACHIFLCQDYEGEVENKEPSKCQGWEWKPRSGIYSMDDKTELLTLVYQKDMFYGW